MHEGHCSLTSHLHVGALVGRNLFKRMITQPLKMMTKGATRNVFLPVFVRAQVLISQSSYKTTCGEQTSALNRVLDKCPASSGDVACDSDTFAGSVALSGKAGCTAIAAALNAAVKEFRGPDGAAFSPVKCGIEDTLYVADKCTEVAGTLNAMNEAFMAGGFQGCEVTTPTTTRTTTLTTTLTTTPTTTPAVPVFMCRKMFDSDMLSTKAAGLCKYRRVPKQCKSSIFFW